MQEKTREQLEEELAEAKRKNEALVAAHTERQISDERYSMKWVEKAFTWFLYLLAGAVVAALLGMVVIVPNVNI